MNVSTVFRIIWLAAGLALALGAMRDTVLSLMARAKPLARVDVTADEPWFAGGFRERATYAFVTAGELPSNVSTAGSWLDGDEWQGRAESAWFDVRRPRVHVGVAGYPQDHDCTLTAEFRSPDGALTRIACPLANPAEQWSVWEIRAPREATAVRLVAEDRSSGHGGWVAFSQPFVARPAVVTAVYRNAQAFAAVALALMLIWGPGLLWWPREASPETRNAFLLGTGPLMLAAFGVLIWCTSGWLRPQTPGLVLVTAVWAALGVKIWRRNVELGVSATTQRMLAVVALVVIAVAAKSTHSAGPEGELFRGSISRNFTVGDRIDSRYSYYVVQVASHHLAPASAQAEKYFFPWTFFSRGPLAGLASLPLVMATGGQPPAEEPDQRWSPFDQQGFAAYRMTMITLASSVVVMLFLILTPFVGERWAFIAGGLLALSPFGVHEMMFTWPKWAATAWLLVSFSLAHARRPSGAGMALATGFLFHPLVLLWSPWVALWACGRGAATPRDDGPARLNAAPLQRAQAAIVTLTRFGVAAGAIVIPWMALGRLLPHLPDTPFAGQSGFIDYFLVADREPATWNTWWQTRWMNFATTFIPIHVYFSGFDHLRFQSAYEASGRLVKFAFVWWNTLPFGLGLGVWALSVAAFVRALRVLRAATWLFAIGPALLMTAYWGWDPLGLMRECGHPLFVAVIAILCVVAAQQGGWLHRILIHRAVPWLQLPETWLMLWLTSLANPRPWAVDYHQLDPFCLVINALALSAAAWVVSRERVAVAADEPVVRSAQPVRA